jgi:anti-sigma factor ChrR (cupin superfamily)
MPDSSPAVLNGDFGVRVVVDTNEMAWARSPSPGVSRKRLHLRGGAESGEVTSIVRYDAGARFPAHDHPGGEEILVLEGVFSDEHGDWPAGTYLLNPEGFRHAPFSRNGCRLFVKLRQAPGRERAHVALQTNNGSWQQDQRQGTEFLELYAQSGFPDTMHLERWPQGAALGKRVYQGGAEILVLEGAFSDERGEHARGLWLRFPSGSVHQPSTRTGCTIYVKFGGAHGIRQADSDD